MKYYDKVLEEIRTVYNVILQSCEGTKKITATTEDEFFILDVSDIIYFE